MYQNLKMSQCHSDFLYTQKTLHITRFIPNIVVFTEYLKNYKNSQNPVLKLVSDPFLKPVRNFRSSRTCRESLILLLDFKAL